MRGATWRILATALFVSGSFGFLCFPLYSSKNLSPQREPPSPLLLLFFYLFAASLISQICTDLRSLAVSESFAFWFSLVPKPSDLIDLHRFFAGIRRFQAFANW